MYKHRQMSFVPIVLARTNTYILYLFKKPIFVASPYNHNQVLFILRDYLRDVVEANSAEK